MYSLSKCVRTLSQMFATMFKVREIRKRYWCVWFGRRLLLLVLLFVSFVVVPFFLLNVSFFFVMFIVSCSCFFHSFFFGCFFLFWLFLSPFLVSFSFIVFFLFCFVSFFLLLFVSSFLCFISWLLISSFESFVLLWLLGETWSVGRKSVNQTKWNMNQTLKHHLVLYTFQLKSIHPSTRSDLYFVL